MKAGIHIALVGNPNCGKSSLFNALTGLNQKVGNFPGVTVDKKTGEGVQAKVIFHTKSHKDSLETEADGSFEKSVVENIF